MLIFRFGSSSTPPAAFITTPLARMAAIRGLVRRGLPQSYKAPPSLRLSRRASGAISPQLEPHIFAFKCGSLQTRTELILKDTRVGTPMEIPVTFFLIRHGSDWVAFDTGNNIMASRDPLGYWGAPILGAYKPKMDESEEFGVQIQQKMGLRPADLRSLILSHGHLDHAGAVDNFAGTGVPSG